MSDNLYEILGVAKDASFDDIKKAYRVLAKKYHPDLNSGDDASERKFKDLQNAYDVLSDQNKRANYDRYGTVIPPNSNENIWANWGGGNFFTDIMNGYGHNFSRPIKAKAPQVFVKLEITLEEARFGCKKYIEYNQELICDNCDGLGGTGSKTCNVCNGTKITEVRHGNMSMRTSCRECNGQGTKIADICKSCDGKGLTEPKLQTRNFDVPQGVMNGMHLVVNTESNPRCPDPIVRILFIQHEIFQISESNNLDVILKIPVNYSLLVFGGDFEVPTFDGIVKITIPPFTKPGKIFRIAGKGMPNGPYHKSTAGALLIIPELEMPPADLVDDKEYFAAISDLKNHESKNSSELSQKINDYKKNLDSV